MEAEDCETVKEDGFALTENGNGEVVGTVILVEVEPKVKGALVAVDGAGTRVGCVLVEIEEAVDWGWSPNRLGLLDVEVDVAGTFVGNRELEVIGAGGVNAKHVDADDTSEGWLFEFVEVEVNEGAEIALVADVE